MNEIDRDNIDIVYVPTEQMGPNFLSELFAPKDSISEVKNATMLRANGTVLR